MCGKRFFGFGDLLIRDTEVLRRQFHMVKFFGKMHKGSITVFFDFRNDSGGLFFDFRGITGTVVKSGKFRFVIR